MTEDLAVTESDLALSERGHFGVVGDHNDGMTLAVKVAKKLGDDGLVGSVKVASGFVSKEDRWVVDQGARDADALLFAARQFAGQMVNAVSKANSFQRSSCLGFVGHRMKVLREHYIFNR